MYEHNGYVIITILTLYLIIESSVGNIPFYIRDSFVTVHEVHVV